MKKILLISLFFLMAFLEGNAVTYYSNGVNGAGADPADVTELANWSTNPTGTSYTPAENPASFTNAGDVFRIINAGVMTASAAWILTPTSTFMIESGGDFTSGSFSHTFILDMQSGATYRKGAAVYTNISFAGTMSSSSLFSVESSTGAFRPLNYPCSVEFTSGTQTLTTAGNNLTIGGNLSVTSGTVRGATTNNGVINITGDLIISGGTLTGAVSSGIPAFSCNNLTYSGGTFVGTSSSSSPTFTVTGNLKLNGASYRAKTSTGTPTFNLNGTSKSIEGPSLLDANHIVNLNGSYTLATNFTVGGTLNLNNAFTLNLSTFKATLGGALNVVGSGGLFSSSSGTLEFASSTASVNLPPVTVSGLIINCSSQTVNMTGGVVVGDGGLVLTNGTLSIGSNTLTLNKNISGTATLLGGSSSNIIVGTNGAGSITSFPSVTLNNLSLNRSGGVTLAGNVAVGGTLTLTSGTLDNSVASLTLGTGATIVRNDGGTDGFISTAPIFSGSVNIRYTGTEAITSGNELPTLATALNNLTMNNASTVTISSAKTVNGALTLTQGTLVSGGNLTMNLNAGYISKAGSGILSGNINCTRTINRSGYTTLSTPVQGSPAFPASSFFFYYDELLHDRSSAGDAGWKAISPTSLDGTISASKMARGYSGYYSSGSTALSLTGSYDHSANYTLTVTKTAGPGDTDTQNGWNLLGNPYPSALDWDLVRSDNSSIADAQCQYYNGTGYVAYASGVPAGLNEIPPMQSVFIKKPGATGTSASLNIDKSRRLDKTKNFQRKAVLENVLEIAIDNGELNDKTYVRLAQNATDGFDSDFDANKMNNSSSILPNVNTILNGVRFAINTFSSDSLDNKMIPLKITVPTSGNYNFKFREEARIDDGIEIYLHDKLRNTIQDIRLNPVYNIAAVKGDTSTRYFISFKGGVTGVENAENISTISAHYDKGTVNTYFKNINANTAEVSFYNTMGMEIYNKKNVNIASGKYSFSPNIVQAGVYILKVSTADKTYTQRILINL